MSEEPNTWHRPYQYERPPHGEFGALTFIGNRVVCHVCGRDFLALGTHISKVHGLSGYYYRRQFGLPYGTALAGDSYRRRMVEHWQRREKIGGNEHLKAVGRGHSFHKGERTEAELRAARWAAVEAAAEVRRRVSQKRGIWATAHDVVDAWEAGLSMDDALGRLRDLVGKRRDRLAHSQPR